MSIFCVVSPGAQEAFSRRRSESLETGQSGFSSTGVVKTGVPDFLYFSFRDSPKRARRFFSRARFDSKSVPRRSQMAQNMYFTHKTRSQTMRTRVFTYKTRSQSVPDASEHVWSDFWESLGIVWSDFCAWAWKCLKIASWKPSGSIFGPGPGNV